MSYQQAKGARDQERETMMLAFRAEGRSMQEIATHYGVSRERVRQILDRARGGNMGHVPLLDPIAVLRFARSPCVTSMAQVAGHCGTAKGAVVLLFGSLGILPAIERLYRWRKWRNRAAYRALLLQQLRAFYTAHGRAPQASEHATPHTGTLQYHFGSLSNACRAAGIPALRPGQRRSKVAHVWPCEHAPGGAGACVDSNCPAYVAP